MSEEKIKEKIEYHHKIYMENRRDASISEYHFGRVTAYQDVLDGEA